MTVHAEIGEWSSEADTMVRVAHRRSRALRVCLVGLVLIAAGISGLIAVDGSVAHLRATGVHAEARVVDLLPATVLGQTRLQVIYPAPGYADSAYLQAAAPLSHMGAIEVVYAKGDPHDVVIARGPELSSTGLLGALCMAGMGVGGLLILVAIGTWRRAPGDELAAN